MTAALSLAGTACSSGSRQLRLVRTGAGDGVGVRQRRRTHEFQYGDMPRLRELGIVDVERKPVIDTRWQLVVGYGVGPVHASLGRPVEADRSRRARD